jgi:hypothetical protein
VRKKGKKEGQFRLKESLWIEVPELAPPDLLVPAIPLHSHNLTPHHVPSPWPLAKICFDANRSISAPQKCTDISLFISLLSSPLYAIQKIQLSIIAGRSHVLVSLRIIPLFDERI